MECAIRDCSTEAVCRGWCQKHYTRWKRTGDPEKLLRVYREPPRPPSIPKRERWETKVDKSGDCWLWKGATNRFGYGQLRTGHKGLIEFAHRLGWEFYRGPIPAGMQVLHRCDNPPCVNPDHLWLGTPKENALDRQAKGRQNRRSGDLRKTVPTRENGRWRGGRPATEPSLHLHARGLMGNRGRWGSRQELSRCRKATKLVHSAGSISRAGPVDNALATPAPSYGGRHQSAKRSMVPTVPQWMAAIASPLAFL